MSELVLAQSRRRRVANELGMSFSRTRALRRVAAEPRTMSELAEALGMDRPNVTVLVDDLEQRGLVARRAHPTDRRAKLVVATAKGKRVAAKANEILATPPAALSELELEDLVQLREILGRINDQGKRE
jgi:DNA-binding MarR family transcriptional regulator